jgi:hypothetical protein
MPSNRSDLSPYLVHLTRDYEGTSARSNLLSILASKTIEARNPYGVAIARLRRTGRDGEEFMRTQRVVCFSETPPHALRGLIDPGKWRRYKFRPYGLAFAREQMLNYGTNPVWYLNGYPGLGFKWLAHDVNALIDAAATGPDGSPTPDTFAESSIARLTPFMEVMGAWRTEVGAVKEKDFTFEREWRLSRSFNFSWSLIEFLILPPGQTESFRRELTETGEDSNRAENVRVRELADDAAQGITGEM